MKINKIEAVKSYGFVVETEAEAISIANEIYICDCCGWSIENCSCGILSGTSITLAEWWEACERNHGLR